jgi:7-cyano-7-deazaguanine reductase
MATRLTKLGNPQGNRPDKKLETFDVPRGLSLVILESNEVVCSCPITSQPDIYRVAIEYEPTLLCIESKSLKTYFWTFKDESMFGEQLAATILSDICTVLNPLRCTVKAVQNIRGGIQITSIATKEIEDD